MSDKTASIDVSRITERPWHGPDATTGWTMEQFAEALDGIEVPSWVSRAAVSICRAYAIKGLSDVGYIANTINGEFSRANPLPVGMRVTAEITMNGQNVHFLTTIVAVDKNTVGQTQYQLEGLDGWVSAQWVRART